MASVPRPFTPDERVHIAERLREVGRAAFAARGLRRVTVDDLAAAAGISKGAFYLFFDSKEALLLDLFQRFEADFQRKILDEVLRPEFGPAESLRMLLRTAVEVRGTDPLLRNLSDTDAEILMRRIPAAQAALLLEADVASARRFVDYWREQGSPIGVDAEILAGLMRAIVLTAFRQQEIGAAVYQQVVQVLIDSVAQRLATRQEPSGRRRAHV
jgi:AcrR family transcriptional regulator